MSAAIAATCVLVLALVGRRARLGARTRALAGVRLSMSGRLLALSPARAVVGALAGFVIAGGVGVVVGVVVAVTSEPIARARQARTASRRMDEQLPEVLRSISAAVRAGRSLPQALEAANEEAASPAREALDAVLGALASGVPFDEALSVFARKAATPAAHEVAATLRIGRAAGANLPMMLDVAVESMGESSRIARDRRAATSQARLSAIVVGSMPVAFFAMVGSSAREQLRVLTHDPIGWALLGAGLGLEFAGAMWMRSMSKARA